MRLTQIRNIVAAADAGSMRRAARTLRVAQPDLTRSIRELEQELGLKLLERSPRGVAPTRAGKAILARARNVQNELGHMREEASQLTGVAGTVSFGAGPLTSALLPGAMAAFRRQHSKAEVRIVNTFGLTLLSQLREGLIEFAVTLLPPGRSKDKGIKAIPLIRSWRIIVGRSGHPLRNAETLDKLVDADWLLQSPPEIMAEPTPWWFTDLFQKNGLTPPHSIVRCDGQAHTALLLNTDMIGVQPSNSVLFQIGAVCVNVT